MRWIFIVFAYLAALLLLSLDVYAEEQVCFTEAEAVTIITLLDASERDLDYITSCEDLVRDLYKVVEDRDNKIIVLTENLIKSKQDAIEYKASRDQWRRVVIYGGVASAAVLLIKFLPLL